MKKLIKSSLEELAKVMPVLSEEEQRVYVGGGDGTRTNPYTFTEYESLLNENPNLSGCFVTDSKDTVSYCLSSAKITAKKEDYINNNDSDTTKEPFSFYKLMEKTDSGTFFDSGYNESIDSGSTSGGDSGSAFTPICSNQEKASKVLTAIDAVANGLSIDMETKRAAFEYVEKHIGDIGRSGEVYLKITENIGKGCGIVGAGISFYEACNNPTFGKITKVLGDIILISIKVNPYAGIAITVLDMTGATDWFYDKIGDIMPDSK